MDNLTNEDYLSILKYYNVNIHEKMKENDIKHRAENILANKLCKCIKKVSKKNRNENGAIALCRKTVIQRKGLDIFNFACKNKNILISKKNTKIKLIKKKINKTKKRRLL